MPKSSHKPHPLATLEEACVDAWPEVLRRLDTARFLGTTAEVLDGMLALLDQLGASDTFTARALGPLIAELRTREREHRTPPTGNA